MKNKINLGISVYPEFYDLDKILKYLKKVKKLGYKKVFSTIQLNELNFENTSDKLNIDKYKEVFDYCKNNELKLAIDINKKSLKKLNASCHNLKPLYKLNITCIRLDGGFSDQEFLDLINNEYGIIIEENCSNIKTTLKRLELVKNKNTPNLQVCFNFFPLEYTAHSYDYVKDALNSIKMLKPEIKIGAFISAPNCDNELCSANFGIVTIEKQRYKSVEVSYLELKNLGLNEIIFGQGNIDENNLLKLRNVDVENQNYLRINLNTKLSSENENILFNYCDNDREDSSENMLRLTNYRSKLNIEKNDFTPKVIKPYSVIMENELATKRYFGEIKINLVEFNNTKHWNIIATIDEEYHYLAKLYKNTQTKFIFKKKK